MRWKAGGYLILLYSNDHPPLHVHIYKNGRLVAKYDIENGTFMKLVTVRQKSRILAALRRAKIIG